jgi:hypothetical protein
MPGAITVGLVHWAWQVITVRASFTPDLLPPLLHA